MKFTLQKRKASRKDYSYHKSHKLGAVALPDSLLFLSPILNQDQEDCTAYSSVATRDSEVSGAVFDPQQFWNDELAFAGVTTSEGFDLQVPLAVGVEKGFCPMGNPTLRQNKASAYFFVTPNNGMDLFDSVRSAIFTAQYPVIGGCTWMNEWTTATAGVINTAGTTVAGGHAIKIAGWSTNADGTPLMVLQNSWGANVGVNGCFYMTREVFNSAFSGYGVGLWSDSQNVTIKTLGLIAALYINIITLLQK